MSLRLIYLNQKKGNKLLKHDKRKDTINNINEQQYVGQDWKIYNIQDLFNLNSDEQLQAITGMIISGQYDKIQFIINQNIINGVIMDAATQNYNQKLLEDNNYINILIQLCIINLEYFMRLLDLNLLQDLVNLAYSDSCCQEQSLSVVRFFREVFTEHIVIDLQEKYQLMVINVISVLFNILINYKRFFWTQSQEACFLLRDLIQIFIPYVDVDKYIQTIYELMFSIKIYNQIISLQLLGDFIHHDYQNCEIYLTSQEVIHDLIQQFNTVYSYDVLSLVIDIIYILVEESETYLGQCISNIQLLDSMFGDSFFNDSRWIKLNQLISCPDGLDQILF